MYDPSSKQMAHGAGGGMAQNYATMPMQPASTPFGGAGFGMPPAAPASNPFAMAQQNAQMMMMNNHQLHQTPYQPNGASFMTQAGPPAFTGLGSTAAPQYQPHMQQQQQFQSNPFGTQAVVYDNLKNLLQPKDPFASSQGLVADSNKSMGGAPAFANPQFPTANPPMTVPSQTSVFNPSAAISAFDPFGPPTPPFGASALAPAQSQSSGGALADRLAQNKRQTQESQRSQLGLQADAFSSAMSAPKISLKDVNSGSSKKEVDFFSDNADPFAGQTFGNVDDEPTQDWEIFAPKKTKANAAGARATEDEQEQDDDEISSECDPNEYDVRFETGRKLGVLMERVDVWGKHDERRQESAVVKLVVENGAADVVGVSVGSSVIAINRRKVQKETYTNVLEMIKSAPRPLTIRFQRGLQSKDTTQGMVLTRISGGTFSVGNLTSGNAVWTSKYFAFGGAKMDVLQLFVSRAAYHECVIALYEKRNVFHTQIQSFRLCRDHKVSPIKSKIYKGYGNLHYFALNVPSLRFVAAKFASEDYETLKALWSHTYEAIERKKRM